MRRKKVPFRRPVGPGQLSQLGARARVLLRRAHHMMENGQHANAAQIFQQMAEGARDRGRLKIAPNLFLQAARAYLLSDNPEAALGCIFDGLGVIVQTQKWPALARIGSSTIAELNALGFPEISDQVAVWLKEKLPEPMDSYPERRRGSKSFPLKCPNCGGALRPGEVEILDARTGECPYCGSAVRTE